MPPPLPGLFGKELVNVPVKLLYSRRALLQKIIANAAKRKTQLHIDATGARMSATPDAFNFGKTVFNNMHKQAAPVSQVLGPLLKRLSGVAGKAVGGLKTYGKRLTGDSTLKPMMAKRDLMRDMEKSLTDFADIREIERMAGLPKGTGRGDLLDTFPLYAKLEQTGFSPTSPINAQIRNVVSRNYQRSRILDPKDGFLSNIYRQLAPQNKAIEKELDAIRKTRLYTGGAASGATLGGVGAAAYNNLTNEKQSDNLPTPSSRGETKKVTMPKADKQEPDLDPEGVQMTDQDHNIQKEARFGTILKMLAKGVYKTPRSLKALAAGGTGGYVTGRQHGHQVGMDAGREDAAKTLSDLLQKKQKFSPVKQAFMGVGALAGMATAPNKDEEDLSIGRGALRGVGTGLGVGTGALTGGALGGLGGAGIGALLGALTRGKYQRMGDAVSNGVAGGAGLGMLAGGAVGGVYGGYKGNKATKALLDKTAPLDSEKKKKPAEDDEDVKEAAAAVLAQLQKNAADHVAPKAYSSVSTGQTQGGPPPGAYTGKVSVPVDSRPAGPLAGIGIDRLPFAGRLPSVSLGDADVANRVAGNPRMGTGHPTDQNFVPNRILVPATGTGTPTWKDVAGGRPTGATRNDVANAAKQVARQAAPYRSSPLLDYPLRAQNEHLRRHHRGQ